jgi:murein DD-endopeptidase MepM/ murein hydrolase activator NlpD
LARWKIAEYLFFELPPIASGNYGYFDNPELVMQQSRHLGIEWRLTFGKRTVQIEHNKLFHSGIAISSAVTVPRGRKVYAWVTGTPAAPAGSGESPRCEMPRWLTRG